MKKNRICVVFVMFVMLFGIVRVAAEPVTIVGKSKFNIPTFNLNNGKYADLENLGMALFPGALFVPESGTIISKYYKIKCSNGSFFVLLKTTEEQTVAQMTLPSVEIGGRIKVPFVEFLGALGQLGLIEYDNTSEGSFIQFKSGKIEEKAHESDKDVFVKQAGISAEEDTKDAKYVRIRPKDKHLPDIQPKPVYPKKTMIVSEESNAEAEDATTNEEHVIKHSENETDIIHYNSEPPTANLPIPEQPAGKYSIPPELNRSVIEELLPKK